MNGSHSRHEWAKNDAMSVRRNRLHDKTIDEVSLVDRAANQLANIAFSKAANQEDDMPEQLELFDEDGFPVDTDSLDINDVVYDADGNPGVIVPDDDDADMEYEDDGELVGKAYAVGAGGVADRLGSALLPSASKRPRFLAGHQFKEGWRRKGAFGAGASRSYKTGGNMSRNRGKYAVGAAVPAGAGAAYGGKKYYDDRSVGKSLGDAVLEELSKAASEDERSEIIASAMQEVEIAKAQAEQAMAYAEQAQDEQLEIAFISKAAEYNLPVSPEVLGPILNSASAVLSDEQLDVLDQLFSGIGEYLYEELGVVGDTDNDDVYSQVDLAARELVGKADGSISTEQATTMMFETNPAAYEQYLAENGR